MKKAILIINEFLNTHKFNEIHMWLVEAARKKGIELVIYTNAEILVTLNSEILLPLNSELLFPLKSESNGNAIIETVSENIRKPLFDKNIQPEFILFWDKDIRLAKYLESLGYPVYNSARAIEACDDKSLTHMLLQSAGIPMPRTILAPMTYANIGYTNYDFIPRVIENLGFPMIIKECFGSFGQQVYLVHSLEEILDKMKQIGAKPMLFQEYIKTSFARDIRLHVVGDHVVTGMYRYTEDGDFRANISNGGKMKPYEWTKEQEELAVRSCKILDLNFAGVDLLFGKEEEPIVCEVNSNAHFKNIFDCTGVNVAEYIIDYILKDI